MSKLTESANGEATPADGHLSRRSAIGSLIAAGAVLAAPSTALAAHPDAELLALSRRVIALCVALKAAEDKAFNLEKSQGLPVYPETLIVTAQDTEDFPLIKTAVGEPFTPGDVKRSVTRAR